MNIPFKIPFYAKASLIFIGLLAFISVLYLTQNIIVPLIYATIFAIVLSPIVNFLVRKKINRTVAISLTITLMVVVSISILVLLSTQVKLFSDSFPQLIINLKTLLHNTVGWISINFNISTQQINTWIDETNAEIFNNYRAQLGNTLVTLGSLLVILFLIPVYIFIILFYQPLLIEFIHKLFSTNKFDTLNEVLSTSKRIIQSYLVGLLFEAFIIAILNAGSLLILGIDYAILLGVIGALLNVIPYLGGIIAVGLTMIVTLATKSPTYALLVLVAHIIIQLIDNNFLIPRIMASKVQINALVSIVVVLAGGALWGIPGMFLSIPITAILKVIFDHIDGLKPWGFLLGNSVPSKSNSHFIRLKK